MAENIINKENKDVPDLANAPDDLSQSIDSDIPASLLDNAIDAALKGDKNAFEYLFSRHRDRVLAICHQYCRSDQSQAYDLCQETFISAFNNLKELKNRSRFPVWLAEIARNKCISHTRKQRTIANTLRDYEVLRHTIGDDNDQGWTDEEFNLIEKLITSIKNPSLKETIQLFYMEGKKTTEVAEIQGITQTAVTTRLNRFRVDFRKRMTLELIRRKEDR